MSANVIIFDGVYTADQMRNIDKAKDLVERAIERLKHASLHEGWKCPETRQIDNGLDTIKTRLNRIDQGIVRTGIALGRGMQGFVELEERAASQAEGLSNDLKSKYGFDASTYGQDGGSTTLHVTQVPDYDDGTPISGVNTDSDTFDPNGDVPEDIAPILKHLQNSLGALWSMFSAVLRNGGAKIPGLYKKLKGALSDFVDTFGELEGVSEEEFGEKFFEVFGNTVADIGDIGGSLGDAIVYSFTEGWESWFASFGIDTSRISAFIQNGWENGKKIVGDIAEGISNWFNSLMPWGK